MCLFVLYVWTCLKENTLLWSSVVDFDNWENNKNHLLSKSKMTWNHSTSGTGRFTKATTPNCTLDVDPCIEVLEHVANCINDALQNQSHNTTNNISVLLCCNPNTSHKHLHCINCSHNKGPKQMLPKEVVKATCKLGNSSGPSVEKYHRLKTPAYAIWHTLWITPLPQYNTRRKQNSNGLITPLFLSGVSSLCLMVNAAKPTVSKITQAALKKPPRADTATMQGFSLETFATIPTTSMVKGMYWAQQHITQPNWHIPAKMRMAPAIIIPVWPEHTRATPPRMLRTGMA